MIAFETLSDGIVCLSNKYVQAMRRGARYSTRVPSFSHLMNLAREDYVIAEWLLDTYGVDCVKTTMAESLVAQHLESHPELRRNPYSMRTVRILDEFFRETEDADVLRSAADLPVRAHREIVTLPGEFCVEMDGLGWPLDAYLGSFLSIMPTASLWFLSTFASAGSLGLDSALHDLRLRIGSVNYRISNIESALLQAMQRTASKLKLGNRAGDDAALIQSATHPRPAAMPDFRIIRLRQRNRT